MSTDKFTPDSINATVTRLEAAFTEAVELYGMASPQAKEAADRLGQASDMLLQLAGKRANAASVTGEA